MIEEYSKHYCFPEPSQIFRAFKLTSFENVKVVILGQDPYHGNSQADGLAFSVPVGVKAPPSLRGIVIDKKFVSKKVLSVSVRDIAGKR